MPSKPSRLRAARASSVAVLAWEVSALQAARNSSPQRHWAGSSRGRSFSGESGASSSLGNWRQIDGSASGCTYE